MNGGRPSEQVSPDHSLIDGHFGDFHQHRSIASEGRVSVGRTLLKRRRIRGAAFEE
jgi:hypothetical protein